MCIKTIKYNINLLSGSISCNNTDCSNTVDHEQVKLLTIIFACLLKQTNSVNI